MTMTLTEMAAKGGRERARKLSKARRHEIALKAGQANKARIESQVAKSSANQSLTLTK